MRFLAGVLFLNLISNSKFLFAGAVLETVRCGQARADLQVCLFENESGDPFIQLNYTDFVSVILDAKYSAGSEGNHIQWFVGKGLIKEHPMEIAVRVDTTKDLQATVSYLSAPNASWYLVPETSQFQLKFLHAPH